MRRALPLFTLARLSLGRGWPGRFLRRQAAALFRAGSVERQGPDSEGTTFWPYFHGDNGAGLGASHQTGWTGLVAKLIQLFGSLDAQATLEGGKLAGFIKGKPSKTKIDKKEIGIAPKKTPLVETA
jgi:hypothetical protein